jgi:hypothetical protein
MSMPNKTSRNLIYGLSDPLTGQLRYVGKSTTGLKRPRSEHNRVLKGYEGFGHRQNWIRNLHDSQTTYRISIIQECADSDILCQAETFWISYFRTLGAPLTNLTDGGDGVSGWKHTPSSLAKLKLANVGKTPTSQCLAASRLATTGSHWTHTPETKSLISARKLGQKYQPESLQGRANKSRAHGGRPFIDQTGRVYQTLSEAQVATGVDRANVSAVLRGKYRQCKGFVFTYQVILDS